MKQAVTPAGTDPNATNESIIESELEKLKDFRKGIQEDNQRYLDEHPEIHRLIDDFIAATISQKPADLVKFGAFYFNNLKNSKGIGHCPVIFAGPSGVGKGTLVNRLMETFPSIFGFSVSHTTRAPREGEQDGVHYHFVGRADMEDLIENGKFIEFARVHTNTYGTSFKAVEKVRSQGKVCILDIDVQGVQNVKKSSLDCKYIFVAPPSMEELEKRLKGRGTETVEKIKVRMANAVGEMEYGQQEGNFDKIIINDNLESSFTELVATLQGWFPDLDLYLKK